MPVDLAAPVGVAGEAEAVVPQVGEAEGEAGGEAVGELLTILALRVSEILLERVGKYGIRVWF